MKTIPVNPFIPMYMQQPDSQTVWREKPDFGGILKSALEDINRLQHKADEAARQLVLGEDIDIHQVMIMTEQARLALQATLQVRNKLIEAYQEISRMQI